MGLEEIQAKARAVLEKGGYWIEWVHGANFSVKSHCEICTTLNQCWFAKNNMPPQPVHPNCHCTTTDIRPPVAKKTVWAICPEPKIKDYLFVDTDKKRFMNINGYDTIDATFIIREFERQAVEKYANGDYQLGSLNKYGQRITIALELPSRTGTSKLEFNSGWMVHKNGIITNTTPATNLSRSKSKKGAV